MSNDLNDISRGLIPKDCWKSLFIPTRRCSVILLWMHELNKFSTPASPRRLNLLVPRRFHATSFSIDVSARSHLLSVQRCCFDFPLKRGKYRRRADVDVSITSLFHGFETYGCALYFFKPEYVWYVRAYFNLLRWNDAPRTSRTFFCPKVAIFSQYI